MIRAIFRFFGGLFFFGAPMVAILLGIVFISLNNVFGPLDPPSIDRPTLIRVMQIRDFRQFTPEQLAAMTDRAEAEFGRDGAMRPIFDFTPMEKKIYAFFQNKKSARKAQMEINLLLMARTRYFQWMNDFERFPETDRTALMKKVTADMKYWETLYMDFLRAAELPIPSMAELIREFDKMIEDFKIGASAEEIVRIDAFKQRMNAAIVAGEVQGAVKNVSNVFRILFHKNKKKPDKLHKND